MTHSNTRIARTIWLGTSCLFTAALVASASARAGGLPSGGNVVGGTATISNPNGHSTVINQTTDKAIINWQDFSIAAGNSVTFNQLNQNSIALNRVLGSTPSTINGDLFANGHVWLINGNGVLFGKGAQVNVGSLIATTADIDNQNFLTGRYKFGSASSNPNAAIVNNGLINANNGSVVLAGPVVSNNGVIQADMGNVILGGVSTFSVDFTGDNLLRFQVGAPVQQTPTDKNGHPVKALVTNTGTISAKGGRVLMTTRAAENVVDNVINNTGMVEATSVSMKDGEIILDAGDGTVEAGGSLDASGKDAGEKGGKITVEGKTIVVADGATLDASGDQGGGIIRIGGGAHGEGNVRHATTTTIGKATINADAITKGDGGTVVVWSDGNTSFAGSISARGGVQGGNGGFVETSGAHLSVADTARVSTLAPLGATGNWLLDPDNIIIESDAPPDDGDNDYVDPDSIIASLDTTDVTLEAAGRIDVLSDLIYASPNTLSLLAQGDVNIRADVQNTRLDDGGAINAIAGWDGVTTPNQNLLASGAYGNGFNVVHVGGEGYPSGSIGAASGRVTVAGTEVQVYTGFEGHAQIGYRGAGGGDIYVYSAGDIDVQSNGGYALIGNGTSTGSVDGDITGDIWIHTGDETGALHFIDNSQNLGPRQAAPGFVGHAWLGNVAGEGFVESGNLTVIGSIDDEHLAADFGFTDMITAALGDSSVAGSGGDVMVALFGNSIDLQTSIYYDSAHALTLMSTNGIQLGASVQNVGTGDLTLIAGWDGTTLSRAHLTDAGVYGNGFGSLGLGHGEGDDVTGPVAFGSKGGTTTVAAQDITFYNADSYAQIGYHGAGTGNINVTANGDLTLIGGGSANTDAYIGNGAPFNDVVGDISGDISIKVTGLTTLEYGGDESEGGLAWIGNRANDGFKATGNVTLTTGDVSSYGTNSDDETPNDLVEIMAADLGTSADTGGNFTLQLTDPGSSFLDETIGRGNLTYDSPHDLTILSARSMDIAYSIQNAGSGNLSLFAGWDGTTAAANVATTEGAYGNNNGVIWVAGQTGNLLDDVGGTYETHGVDSGEGTAVGSRGGVTTVGAAQVYVEGLSGYAQIGYHGDGGSGTINVIANGTPGSGTLNGVQACFDGNANICLIGGREGISDGTSPTYAQIGNLGQGVSGLSTADINVTASGNISISSGGNFASDEGDANVANGSAFIGSGDAARTVDQSVGGDIAVHAGGQINLFDSTATNSNAWIGNITGANGSQSGDVSIFARSIANNAPLGSMLARDLGGNSTVGLTQGGNVTLALTGDFTLTTPIEYSSQNTLSILSTGDIEIDSGVQNQGSGSINAVAGWNGTTLDPQHFTDNGVFGNHGGSVSIVGSEIDPAAIGSATGTTTIAGKNVSVISGSGDGQFAMIGYYGGGLGDIDVRAKSDVIVTANGDFAQIGNGGRSPLETGGNAGGDIDIKAGAVEVTANDGFAQIGNGGGGWDGNVSGDIAIALNSNSASTNAGRLHVEVVGAGSRIQIGNGGSVADGEFTGDISITGARILGETFSAGSIQVGNGGFASQGSASGDIDIGLTDDSKGNSALALNVNGANSTISIGNGGAEANGNATSGFSYTGDITVRATDILLDETAESGSIMIGNGGTVGITDPGSAPLAGDVLFGGNISLTARNTFSAETTGSNGSVVVGNGGVDALTGANIQGGVSTTGDITVRVGTQAQAGTLNLSAGGDGSNVVQIGNGQDGALVGSTASNGITQSGTIDVQVLGGNAHGASATLTSGSSSVVQIGNGGAVSGPAAVGGNIGVTVDGTLTLSGASSPIVGNLVGDTGTKSGNVVVSAYDMSGIEGSMNAVLNTGDFTLKVLDPNSALTLNKTVAYNSAHRLEILGAGDIFIWSSIQNAGSGEIDLVAGWDRTTVEPSSLTLDSVFGNNGGSVVVGGDATGAARLGSKHGETIVRAGTITLGAVNGDAQIGYGGSGGDGDIDVAAIHDVIVNSQKNGADALIGNGGNTVGGNVGGDINVRAGGYISVMTGDAGSRATIGNVGGDGASESGDITVSAEGTLNVTAGTGSRALIGNWSTTGSGTGNASGDIDITSGEVNLTAAENSRAQIGNGRINTNATGDITIQTTDAVLSASGDNAVARIGQDPAGTSSGDISLTATGSVSLSTDSDSAFANAVIGSSAQGNVGGDVMVAAKTVDLSAGDGNSQIRIGNQSFSGGVTGNTTITAIDMVSVLAGAGSSAIIGAAGDDVTSDTRVQGQSSGVLLENGGDNSTVRIGATATGSVGGDVTVSTPGSLQLINAFADSVAQIGNTITGESAGTISGDINVSSHLLSMVNGGDDSTLIVGNSGNASVTGDIAADATNVSMLSLGSNSSVRIGHNVSGAVSGDLGMNVSGNVSVLTGTEGSAVASFAAIGSAAGGDIHGEVNVTARSGGTVTIGANGTGSEAKIGNHSETTSVGDTNVIADGDIIVAALGDSSNAFLTSEGVGHQSGNVLARSVNGGVTVDAGADNSIAQIGTWGSNVDSDVTVHAQNGGVNVIATGASSTALIGNYIAGDTGTMAGTITVTTPTLAVDATGSDATAQIGHGRGDGSVDGDIVVNATNATFTSEGSNSTVRVGNNGAQSDGDIRLTASGALILTASTGNATAQIGSAGSGNGDIDVNATNTTLTASGVTSTARIGGAVDGDVEVTTDNDLALTASGNKGAAEIGHTGSATGATTIDATNATLTGSGDNSTARIGGGNDVHVTTSGNLALTASGKTAAATVGNASGTTTVRAANATLAASGVDSAARIGSDADGDTSVTTTGNLTLTGSARNAVAQIGNTGPGTGDIDVNARKLTLAAHQGANSLAMIGNGGFNTEGNVGGNIEIDVGTSTILHGGTGRAWIGNVAGNGTASGSLTLITGNLDDQSTGDQLHDFLIADIANGDVTLGITKATHAYGPDSDYTYNSSHTFNLLSSGDIVFGGSLQNSGSGAINIVAGWNGEALNPESFGNEGVAGLNGHGVTLELADGNDAGGVAVGSKGGATHIYGDFLTLSATRGYAQLGYHGGGQGAIFAKIGGDVTITGGDDDGFYAQIGHGGRLTNGSNSGEISVIAGGDVLLTGGDGNEAYAQIGHGGAESNTNAEAYGESGKITVQGHDVLLTAGNGDASYVQIGHGGFKVGAGLTDQSEIGGDIAVTASHNISLASNGDDAYAQIGHGGDQMNTNAGASAHGSISGNIVVTAPNGDAGTVDLIAGDGENAYVQIGNGGFSINAPTTAVAANFTISGDVTVTDLLVHGGGGTNGFAMIGNGDNSGHSVGNVSGNISINVGSGSITVIDGTGKGAFANIQNATGTGTVSGNVEGFEDPRPPRGDGDDHDVNKAPETKGVITNLIDNKLPTPPVNSPLPDVILINELPKPDIDTGKGDGHPIEDMAGGDGDQKASDKAAQWIGDSLSGGKKSTSQILLGGILKSQQQGGQSSKPHAVPAADEDYSSWGNEALWQ